MKICKKYSKILVLGLLVSCKSQQLTTQDNLKPLPSTYAGQNDSTNSAKLSWNNYFNDSNLVRLIDEGVKNNADVLIALQKIEASRANFKFAKGALLPYVGANVSLAQRKFGLYTMDGAGNITTDILPGQIVPIHLQDYFACFQTSWEIDLWGKLRNKKKAAFSRFLSGIEGKNLVVTNLVAEIANTYYELMAFDQELEVIRQTIRIQEKALELVTYQKQSAAANELAVQQFRAQLLNSRSLEIETLQNITEAENKIHFLLGRFPTTVPRSADLLNQELKLNSNAGIPSDILKNRPDIRQAELELIAARADVKSAKAAFYPTLNITGFYGFQAFRTDLLFMTPQSLAYSLLGGLTAPLFNRSAIKAEFNSANSAQLEALYYYQKTILNAFTEVNNELSRVNKLDNISELKKQEVDELSRSIETANELFRTSRASYLEVLLAQRNALETKLQLIETKKKQFNARVNIYKSLGGGWRES